MFFNLTIVRFSPQGERREKTELIETLYNPEGIFEKLRESCAVMFPDTKVNIQKKRNSMHKNLLDGKPGFNVVEHFEVIIEPKITDCRDDLWTDGSEIG